MRLFKRVLPFIIIILLLPLLAQADVAVKGIIIDKKYLEMEIYSTEIIIIRIFPNNATNQKITWHSSDKTILSINKVSKMIVEVKALNPGNAYIYGVTDDGKFTARCNIRSFLPIRLMKIEPETLMLKPGEEFQFKAQTEPLNSNYPEIIWQTSDNRVMSIDPNGLGVAFGPGQARVIARSVQNEEIYAYCTVTVTSKDQEETDSTIVNGSLEGGDTLESDAGVVNDLGTADIVPTIEPKPAGSIDGLLLFRIALAAAFVVIIILVALVIRKRLHYR